MVREKGRKKTKKRIPSTTKVSFEVSYIPKKRMEERMLKSHTDTQTHIEMGTE